jgi:hypothetical protein
MSGFRRKPLLCLDLRYFISAGGRLVLAKAFGPFAFQKDKKNIQSLFLRKFIKPR